MAIPQPVTAKKFRYISDYPIDKVIWRYRGSVSVPTAASMADSVTATIPHGLGYRPLVRGIYSEDNFSSYFEIGNDPWFFKFGSWLPRITAQVSSDATNVYMTFLNFDTTRTLYYKLYAVLPSDAVAAPTIVPPNGDGKLRFNTDHNYLKVLRDGKQSVFVPSYGTASVTVGHGLLYRPVVMAWTETAGRTFMSGTETLVGVSAVGSTHYVTDSLFVCSFTSNSFADQTSVVHYRIYVDE